MRRSSDCSTTYVRAAQRCYICSHVIEMMSLSYQLEILCYQAMRLRSLGWAEYLKVEISPDRKTLTASYWMYVPRSRLRRR